MRRLSPTRRRRGLIALGLGTLCVTVGSAPGRDAHATAAVVTASIDSAATHQTVVGFGGEIKPLELMSLTPADRTRVLDYAFGSSSGAMRVNVPRWTNGGYPEEGGQRSGASSSWGANDEADPNGIDFSNWRWGGVLGPLQTTSSDPGVRVQAFRDDTSGQVHLVVINNNAAPEAVSASLAGPVRITGAFAGDQTVQGANNYWVPLPGGAANPANAVAITVPGHSITGIDAPMVGRSGAQPVAPGAGSGGATPPRNGPGAGTGTVVSPGAPSGGTSTTSLTSPVGSPRVTLRGRPRLTSHPSVALAATLAGAALIGVAVLGRRQLAAVLPLLRRGVRSGRHDP